MQTKFNIGDTVQFNDINGVIEGTITHIEVCAHKQYNRDDSVTILSYETRYNVENRTAEYIDIPEHIINIKE